MTTEPYVPNENDIIMGKVHLGDNYWRVLTEDDVRRGIARLRAQAILGACQWFALSPHINYRGTQVRAKLKGIASRIEDEA